MFISNSALGIRVPFAAMKGSLTISLLLVGFVVVCTARNTDQNSDLEQGSESSEESTETKELMQELQTICYNQTGSNQAFETLIESFNLLPVCFFNEINAVEFMNDLGRLKANVSTRHEFFPKYCPQIRNTLPCLDVPVKAFSKCLDEDDIPILYAMYNVTPKVLDLLCENNGEFLFQDGESLGDCLKNYSKYMDICTKPISDSTNVMAMSKYGEVQCREVTQMHSCLQSKFTECRGSRLMVMFDMYWDALMENSPCRNFLSSEPDRTS